MYARTPFMSRPVDTFSTCWAPWLASCKLVENKALWGILSDVEIPSADAYLHPRQIIRISAQHLLNRL